MREWRLEPVDSLFFGGGTPFSAEISSQEDVSSLFPPPPSVVAGALRAALARAQGWEGRGRWSTELDPILGDGMEKEGTLRTAGPFVHRVGRLLFPMPRHLVGYRMSAWKPVGYLTPGSLVRCDLGEVVLPELNRETVVNRRLEPGDEVFVNIEGLRRIARGGLPSQDSLVHQNELWNVEPRIGLERDHAIRTAKPSMLYSSRHIRLKSGVGLSVYFSGVPEEWVAGVRGFVPLGGESRFAWADVGGVFPRLEPPFDEIEKSGRAALLVLSPMGIEKEVLLGKRELELPGHAKIVTGCVDRPLRIGGWDSVRRRSMEVKSYLPPGSVLFLQLEQPRDFLLSVDDWGLLRIGRWTNWGFGLATIGTWPNRRE